MQVWEAAAGSVNVLDENIIAPERERWREWRIHFRSMGEEVGRGMKDQNEIIPLLHALRQPTFFTRGHDSYRPTLRHLGYYLVYLEVEADETAKYIRLALRISPCRDVCATYVEAYH